MLQCPEFRGIFCIMIYYHVSICFFFHKRKLGENYKMVQKNNTCAKFCNDNSASKARNCVGLGERFKIT